MITDSELSDKTRSLNTENRKNEGVDYTPIGDDNEEDDDDGNDKMIEEVENYKKPSVPTDYRVRPGVQGGKSRVKATTEHNA